MSSCVDSRIVIPMLDLGLQYRAIEGEIKTAICQVLESQHYILGPEVQTFESEIAAYCGRRFARGVASGTDALILALRALGIGPGDEVIVPSFTFIATADAVSLLGAKPVFADIDATTFCIDPHEIARKVSSRTRAVIPVHLYGHPADMHAVLEIGREHNLFIIEDNAQALGATYHGKKTAKRGHIGCLSFFPSKNLGACGDAGMVVTDDEELARRVTSLRAHGATKKYFSVEQGWNSRLDELQAAILRVKLRYLDQWNEQRRSRAAAYGARLKHVPGVELPAVQNCCEHVFHQYTIRVRDRDRVQKEMASRGVASTVYYPVPIHLQPIYAELGYRPGDLPQSERAAMEVLSLPMYPELTDEQIDHVASVVADAVASAG